MDDITAAPTDTRSSDTDAIAPRGTTLATLGFLMMAAGPAILLVASIGFGLDDAPFNLFFFAALFGVLGAVLVRRRGTVAKAIAIVLALLVFLAMFWTAFGLALPSSVFDFVPGLLVLPGILLAIGGTISAIASSKRGGASGPGETRAAATILAVVGLLAIVSIGLTIAGRETVDDDAAASADLTVDLKDFEFDQDAYDVPAGGAVLVKNSDPVFHTFNIDALDIQVDLGPGSEKLVTIPEEPGTFVVYCDPHTEDPEDPSDDDMAAEITVG
jgi:plastocyanin